MVIPSLGVAVLWAALASGNAPAAYDPPRTSAGRPSLEGTWTNASLTRLSRPDNISDLVLSPQRAAGLAAKHFHNARAVRDSQPSSPDRSAPEVVERLPPVGNYNAGWVEPGTTYGVVRGEIRSSWITDPEDGKVPFRAELLEQFRVRRAARASRSGPEVMSLGERCLLGFGGTAGPPMLNVLYNNYYRITQTFGHVVILVEMVHDARIIRLDSEHGPPADRRWLGDSVGHWDGDTLVVETTHFHPARASNGPLYYSSNAVVAERFTRVADGEIHYQFEINDQLHYARPIRGEMSFHRVDARVFEYACHEGNYAMGNILRGARLEEGEGGSEP